MHNITEIRDINYKPELLTIVEYIAHSNCYRAKPFQGSKLPNDHYYLQQIGGTAPFNNPDIQHGVSVNISKNMGNTAQFTSIYAPQTAVMALVPYASSNNPVYDVMGFIIGEIATPIFYTTSAITDKQKVTDFDAEEMYASINKINQTSPLYDMRSNIDETALIGDTLIKSEHAEISLDNISLKTGTDLAGTYYSSVTGEIITTCMLQQYTSVWENNNTYIIKDGVVNIKQYTDNPYDAGLNCLDGAPCVYKFTEAYGKALNGKYFTINFNTTDKQYMVFQEHYANNGMYSLHTATGMKIGKRSNFDFIQCSGSHFKPEMDDTFIYEKTPDTEITYIRTLSEEAYAKDYDKIEDEDIDGNKINIYNCSADIEFADDGSIKIKDAWGSYILLSHGNIQIRAANNMFLVSDRDTIQISGGVESHRAVSDIQMESVDANVKIYAKGTTQIGGDTYSVITNNIIETADKNITLITPYYQCVSKDDKTSTIVLGGMLNSSSNSSNTSINIRSKDTIISAKNTINTVTDNTAVILDNKALTVGGHLSVGGDINIKDLTARVTFDNNLYTTIDKVGGNIKLQNGSLYAKGTVEAYNGVRADYVYANRVAAVNSNNGKLAEIRNLNLASIITKINNDRTPVTKDVMVTVQAAIDFDNIDKNTYFIFDKESAYCCYCVDSTDIITGVTISNINKNTEGQELYIYPGQNFWTLNGLEITNKKNGEIQVTQEGFNKYQFNENNILGKE